MSAAAAYFEPDGSWHHHAVCTYPVQEPCKEVVLLYGWQLLVLCEAEHSALCQHRHVGAVVFMVALKQLLLAMERLQQI